MVLKWMYVVGIDIVNLIVEDNEFYAVVFSVGAEIFIN